MQTLWQTQVKTTTEVFFLTENIHDDSDVNFQYLPFSDDFTVVQREIEQ